MAKSETIKFLLDTNVISELAKHEPSRSVMSWLDKTPEETLFISVVTLAELHRGVARLPESPRRSRLHIWLSGSLPDRFDGRILPVDIAVARQWGIVVAQCEIAGRPMEALDALLAATAVIHKLTFVTRNVRHFSVLGSAVLNPWDITSQI